MKTLQQRFDEKWIPVPESGCWIWLSCVDQNGYGRISFNLENVLAHRVSWELHIGDIPERLHCLHRCDTPACVRPDHLFLGDQSDNMADKTAKNRQLKGEQIYQAVLTKEQVLEIRDDPRIQREIAEDYGVARRTITDIKNKKTWRHI